MKAKWNLTEKKIAPIVIEIEEEVEMRLDSPTKTETYRTSDSISKINQSKKYWENTLNIHQR